MTKLITLFTIILFLSFTFIQAETQVKTVDFLSHCHLKVNAAGPLLVKSDSARNRTILVNTNTSSISLIDEKTDKVTNIPLKNRVLQYLKMEALTIDKHTGNIYIIGNKSLHIVFPERLGSIAIETGEQYEMVAVNEKNGKAYLVGRESKDIAIISPQSKKIKRIPWVDHTEPMLNLNQTPPPPIRKVVCDTTLQQIIAIDGYTSTLHIYSAKSGRLLKKRKLAIKGGTRWHMAGYDEETHHLYIVVETIDRKVNEALKIDIVNGKDIIIELPGLTEAVGINYNPATDEIYIPYDNHPSVHVVDFKNKGKIDEIKIPTFGNDASVIDRKNNLLYIASWGYGEIEVIDIQARKLIKRIKEIGIIPHMFNMTFNESKGELLIPIGATAVNGSFGASIRAVDPAGEKIRDIYTGWAPVALVELSSPNTFLVFNSENQAAQVTLPQDMESDPVVTYHRLPGQFINNALKAPNGTIYISYGPHQSYWPVVYIWGAKNGILSTGSQSESDKLSYYDRRIPRMAQQMAVDKDGVLYALQNNWGKEKQFLITIPDDVRVPNLDQMRLELEDTVIRETTQRILKYDSSQNWLYIVKLGEADDDPGVLQIFDLEKQKIILKYPVGRTPTDLVFNDKMIYITDFDTDTLAAVKKEDFSVTKRKTGKKPFKLALLNDIPYWINHNGNTLQSCTGETASYPLPYPGKPGNIFAAEKELIITSHTPEMLYILSFNPGKKTFQLLHKEPYPFGETTVDTDNTAFYIRGQFADGIFEINQIKRDRTGRIWITDYLAGKLFIIEAPKKPKRR